MEESDGMRETLRIVVCDDEEKDRERLRELLLEYFDEHDLYAQIDFFSSGEELLAADCSVYGLVFLDIFMDGKNGMETARLLLEKNDRLQVVFATTSVEFAAEAFDIEALHYIVKPVGKKQFDYVLDKFFEGYTSMRTLTVKVGCMAESIYISDLLYVEARGKKTVLHFSHGTLEVSQSLAEMRKLLPEKEFCMPIRWALVSMKAITAVFSNTVKLTDQTEIPVSRGKRDEIRDQVAEFKWAAMRRKMRGR